MFFNKQTAKKIYQKIKVDNVTYYKLFGLTIIKKIKNKYGKRLYLLNFKIYSRETVADLEVMLDALHKLEIKIDHLNAVAHIHHQNFAPYRAKYLGREIVVVGCGPTLNKYQTIHKAIHIGVNRAYRYQGLELDFIFIQDISGLKEDITAINAYRPDDCVKFYGSNPMYNVSIPEEMLHKANAKRYFVSDVFDVDASQFYPDISLHIFPECFSVIFPAVMFALFTQPAKIYLVGCDISHNGYFDDANSNSLHIDVVLQGWQQVKTLQEKHYPSTKIISINPIGLKGLFQDEYH